MPMAPHAALSETADSGTFFTHGSVAEFMTPHPDYVSQLPKRAPSTGISILIAGGGTAGLLMALESWRKGHNITRILERSSSPTFTGDIIVLQPSGSRIFRHWPAIKRDLEADGVDGGISYYKHTGEHVYGPVAPPGNDPAYYVPTDGEPRPQIGTNRVRFYQSLLRQVVACGIPIEWGVKVSEFFEDADTGVGGVRTTDDRSFIADVCVAADGMKTSSNNCVRGVEDKVQPSGWSTYRTAFPPDIAFKDPVIKERWNPDGKPEDKFEFYLGPGMHMVVAVSKTMVVWGLTHRDAQLPASAAAESWEPNVNPEDVIAFLDEAAPDWDSAVKALIRATPASSIVHWRLNWRDLAQRWTSPAGRVVQLGDAAHAFLPTSGNGGTQGLEDGACLAACLQLAGCPARAPLAAQVYNALRYERVSCIQKGMFVNSQMKGATDWAKVARDPSSVHFAMNTWAFRQDPEAYAYDKFGEAFHALVNGGPPLRNTNFPPGHTFKSWSIEQVKKDIAAGVNVADLLDGDWS